MQPCQGKRGHIITTAIEHKAVLMPLNDYNNKTIIKPMPDGAVNVSAIEQAIKKRHRDDFCHDCQ